MKILITELQLSTITGDNRFFNVYHRTSSNPAEVVKGFIRRTDALYGVIDKTDYNRYGDYIIHYKVPNDGKLIIVDEELAKKYYGSNYDLKSQFMNCLGDDFEKYDEYVKSLSEKYGRDNNEYEFEESEYGMRASMGYESNLKTLGLNGKIDGFIYGHKDMGQSYLVKVIQLYKSEKAIPYSYSTDGGDTWTKI
jgi:hypothetical protein